MKVNLKPVSRTVPIEELAAGAVFKFNGDAYIKIIIDTFNAGVNLETGDKMHFHSTDHVESISGIFMED